MQRSLVFIACLLFIISSDAQSPESANHYPFVHYTPKDGLVNSRVKRAYQDSKGRMYFLTYGGLSVFDGARFRNYTTQNGLIIDVVNDILEVGEDSLLVAPNMYGLNVLVRGEMRRLEFPNKVNPIVNHFIKCSNGEIYATADDGLYRLEVSGFRKLSTSIGNRQDSAIYLGHIVEYGDHLVFATNDLRGFHGLYVYNKIKNKVTDFLPDIYVHCLTNDLSGMVWVSSQKTVVLDTAALNKGRLNLFKSGLFEKFPLLEEPGLIVFLKEHILMLTALKQTFRRFKKDGSYQSISLTDISSTGSTNFFIDKENIIWFCHGGSGVYKLTGTGFQAGSSFFKNENDRARFVHAPDKFKAWLILNDNRLFQVSGADKKYYSTKPRLTINAVYGNKDQFYISSANDLYVSSLPGNGTVITLKKILSVEPPLVFGGHSTNDPYGNTILNENANLYVIRKDQVIFRKIIGTSDLIESLCIDSKKQLWTVYRGMGLQLYTIHPEQPANYLEHKRTFTKELGSVTSRSMIIDKNDLIWVGTRYHGLLGFEYKNNELSKRFQFQTREGLTDNFVTSLEIDEDNNILVGTQTGLDRLIPTDDGYRIENITKLNNSFAFITYLWSDHNRNAYALTNDGEVLRAGAAQNSSSDFKPQLVINEIRVNGKNFATNIENIRLSYNQRNINVSVSAPTFVDEKQVKFSYLLDGDGSGVWSDTSSVAEINLLNLSPGNYKLLIKAFFNSTSYQSQEKELKFTIRSAWWQSIWLKIAAILLMAAIGYFIIRSYFLRILERKKMQFEKQQALEQERTRIAIDMHDDLGAGLSKIRFLSETVQRNSHDKDQQPNLQNISTSSVELVDKFNEIIWAMNEKNNSLEDLLYYVRSYAAKYLAENNIDYQIQLPDHIPPFTLSGETRRHIFLMVKESLHNIVKHAAATETKINIETKDQLKIRIRDNGKGFDQARIRQGGNGVRNMQQRIKIIQGTFTIDSENGTTVQINVPLDHEIKMS